MTQFLEAERLRVCYRVCKHASTRLARHSGGRSMRNFKRTALRGRTMIAASLIVAGTVVFVASPVQAQLYPTRPIEIVVPFVAGGTSDIIARMIAQRFTDSWSATVVVNNRPGGGSMIGSA